MAATPRLRSMVIDGDRTILVLDRAPDDFGAARAAALGRFASSIGLAGAVVFPEEIDLGELDESTATEVDSADVESARETIRLAADAILAAARSMFDRPRR